MKLYMEKWCKILIVNFLVLIGLQLELHGQSVNLVPNPGFDSLKACPTGVGQTTLAEPWQWAQTPDLYHRCSTNPTLQVPLNLDCNYLPAHNGDGYVGMYVFNSREFVFTKLTDTLEAGTFYYARFFVAPEEDCGGPSAPTFTDAIGLAVKGPGANDNYVVVAENTGTILKDTLNWTKISGCFQAKGNELYLQIGNFREDEETLVETTDPAPVNQLFNYMFVDDVLLAPFDPFPDTVLLCNGVPVNLDASFENADIQWLTGDTGAFFLAVDTGTYVVEAKLDGCTLREKVTVVNLDLASLSPPDTTFCMGDEIRLQPGIPGIYRWQGGAATQSLTASKTGTYEAEVTNTCGTFTFRQNTEALDCRCRVYVPNVFSPNADGINDLLDVHFFCDYEFEFLKFEVFDRWGGLVWSQNSWPPAPWTGESEGKSSLPGTYVWYVAYDLVYQGQKRRIVEEGEVNLVR